MREEACTKLAQRILCLGCSWHVGKRGAAQRGVGLRVLLACSCCSSTSSSSSNNNNNVASKGGYRLGILPAKRGNRCARIGTAKFVLRGRGREERERLGGA